MVWYSRLFQNFPQFIVIHTVEHQISPTEENSGAVQRTSSAAKPSPSIGLSLLRTYHFSTSGTFTNMEKNKSVTVWWNNSLRFINCRISEPEGLLEDRTEHLLSGDEKAESQKAFLKHHYTQG